MSITIKQAFQKLAMVTGAGVKNPWFVIRNLAQTFADVADNVVDASGETYVTAEAKIGTFLGKDLYRQTISMAGVTQSGTTEVTVATIATNLKIRKLYACIFEEDSWYSCPENNVRLAYIPENGKITFKALKDQSSWNISEGYLIIEYTKS